MPQTVPHLWLQCWHLSLPKIAQFEYFHSLPPCVTLFVHSIHAHSSSNTLLAIKYHKKHRRCSLAYHSISYRTQKPYPATGRTSFMLHCMCIATRQPHPTPETLSYVLTTAISSFSCATIPTYSTATCPYSIPMSILCAFMQERYSPVRICTMDAPSWAQLHYRWISCNQTIFISIGIAFKLSSCTFIHERPWHNCITILQHSKRDILVYRERISKTIYGCFNVPFPHLHRLYPIQMDVHNFTVQQSMNCSLVYKCHKLYRICGFNVGTFPHQ